MGILSIQSQVVAGFVGNAASVFALQRLGVEVWPLPSVLLSHHPGHGGAQGGAVPAALKARLLDGLDQFGCFMRCEAVISGYLSSGDDADLVVEAVRRARRGSAAVYLCDPVLGDDGRTYVPPDVVSAVHNLAVIADIITPNAYELSLLSGVSLHGRHDALRAMRVLQARGPKIVLLSSFAGADTPADTIDVMVLEANAAWRLAMPRLDYKFSGAGDVLAALFLHFWLVGKDSGKAMAASCAALFGVLGETMAGKANELALVSAQHHLVSPARQFSVERLV